MLAAAYKAGRRRMTTIWLDSGRLLPLSWPASRDGNFAGLLGILDPDVETYGPSIIGPFADDDEGGPFGRARVLGFASVDQRQHGAAYGPRPAALAVPMRHQQGARLCIDECPRQAR